MRFPVKVCGITRLEDALIATACGAQAVGFIFHKPSPRYLPPERVREIVQELPPFVVTVGVVVRQSAEEINRITDFCQLDRIQLHGGESAELMAALTRPAYRAFRLQKAADLAEIETVPERVVMLDTFDPDQFGGTGRPFNWEWAHKVGRSRRVILSGGLNPQNAARALETAQPTALDVSSGVEAAPGVKDADKLKAFFQAIESYEFTTPSPWSTERAITT